ncbi:MAG: ROK family protein [Lachnospiraceae bacterium]|nr:ROK family protein [Lachnospiraceae bacterium]
MSKHLTGQPNMMKEINKGLIKSALQKLQTATRVELSAATKISQPTVNTIINELMEERVVIESGMAKSSGGRKAMLYSLNSKIWYTLSVVVEEHELQYAVTDLDGEVIESDFSKHNADWTVEDLTASIAAILKRYKEIRAIAIGVPGAVSVKGVVFAIPKVKCLEGFALKEYLAEKFNVNVSVRNDINTVALGYYASNMTTDCEFACVHLGNTLGAGIIIGGNIVSGSGSFAGEIGFMQTSSSIRKGEIQLRSMTDKEIVLAVSQIMINVICLVNPAVLALGGHRLKESMKNELVNNCKKALPVEMLPEILFIEDERKYYMDGLAQIGMNSMNSDIRLIRDTKS